MESPTPTGSPFDALSRNVFTTTVDIMGYVATWTPSGGGDSYVAKVHFNNPTEAVQRVGIEYNPTAWQMEYYIGDFPGLKALADGRGSLEVVNVAGYDWYVKTVVKKHDGKTYIAELKPVSE